MPEPRCLPTVLLFSCLLAALLIPPTGSAHAQADNRRNNAPADRRPSDAPPSEDRLSPGLPDSLPADLLRSEQALSEEQRGIVEAYAGGWGGALARGESPEAVAEAKDMLLDPIRSRVTGPSARNVYSQMAAEAIQPAMGSDDPLVKMNALIVASELPGDGAVGAAASMLTDANPAVRYWAAKVVAQAVEGGGEGGGGGGASLPEERQGEVLAALGEAMSSETSGLALEQMFRALGGLTVDAAGQTLLDLLDERVALHVAVVGEGLRADRQAMADLQRRLANRQAANEDADAELRQLTATAAKYLQVTADALRQGTVDDSLLPVSVEMVGTVEQVFIAAMNHFDPQAERGPPLLQPAEAGDFNMLRLNVYEWIGSPGEGGVLSESQVAIPPDDLAVPPPAEAPAPAPEPQPDGPQAPPPPPDAEGGDPPAGEAGEDDGGDGGGQPAPAQPNPAQPDNNTRPEGERAPAPNRPSAP